MDLVVDHARQKVFATSIQYGHPGRNTNGRGDRLYPAPADSKISFKLGAFIDDQCVFDDEVRFHEKCSLYEQQDYCAQPAYCMKDSGIRVKLVKQVGRSSAEA